MVEVYLDIVGLIIKFQIEWVYVLVVVCGVEIDVQVVVLVICVGVKEYILLLLDLEMIVVVLVVVVQECGDLIYMDEVMVVVVKLVEQVVLLDVFVLIIGEFGIGKEVIVCYVYKCLNWVFKLFILINCVVILEYFLEFELFGYEKGVFIGVVVCWIGKFEEVDGGMFFFDEIFEMEVCLQVKLLCVIQECVIDWVGGMWLVLINICILVMFNWDFVDSVRQGQFCEDLLFWFNVVNFKLLVLCECLVDIFEFVYFFIKYYLEVNGVLVCLLLLEVCQVLMLNLWLGNVWEFENIMYCVILLVGNVEIGVEVIWMFDGILFGVLFGFVECVVQIVEVVIWLFVGWIVVDVEKDFILDMFDYCFGNWIYVVKIFGIFIWMLWNKLNQYMDEGVQVFVFGEVCVQYI